MKLLTRNQRRNKRAKIAKRVKALNRHREARLQHWARRQRAGLDMYRVFLGNREL